MTALRPRPARLPSTGSGDTASALALLQDGAYAAAGQALSTLGPDPTGLRLTVQVLALLGRNLPTLARQQLNAADDEHASEPLQAAAQLAETLIELAEGEPDAADLHVQLCWQLITDSMTELAELHIPHAIVTQGLRGDVTGVQALASQLPGFGSGGAADTEYAIGLGMAGDRSGARAILSGPPPERPHTINSLRGALHLALLNKDAATMRQVTLQLTRCGLGPLLTRELQYVAGNLNVATQDQVLAPALRVFLNTAEHQHVHLSLIGDREGLIWRGKPVDFGLHHRTAVQLLALLALRARQDRPVLSTAECRQQILSGSEYADLDDRQRSILLAKLVRRIRQALGMDVIISADVPAQTYALNPAYRVTLDLDTVRRLIRRQQWRPAAALLSRGIMQGSTHLGSVLSSVRSDVYADFFGAIERVLDARPAQAAHLAPVLNLFLPWQWPDEEVESKARQLRSILWTAESRE